MTGYPIAALPLAFAGAGMAAGAAGRWLLAHLRRGAVIRPGWCEGTTAALWAVVGWRSVAGPLPWWWLPVPLLLTWAALLLTVTDLVHHRLPDALTLPAYPVVAVLIGAAAAHGGGWRLVAGAAVGAVAFLGVHAAVHLLRPGSLGAGDVKLSGSLGAVLGAVGWPALVLATCLAAMVTIVLWVAVPRWRAGVPHGPGLLAATCLVALFPGTALGVG